MSSFITVDYTVYSTTLSALQALRDIPHTVSLDFEVQSIYTKGGKRTEDTAVEKGLFDE